MTDPELLKIIKQKIPILSDRKLEEAIAEEGQLMTITANSVLMDYGQYIKYIPIVLSGIVKVTTQNKEGKDMLLYYLSGGNTCPTAFTCCMIDKKSDIKAIVEEDAEILSLPIHCIDDWIRKYPTWKNFIMHSYQIRFEELLGTIDDIAFSKIDERLLKYIAKKQKLTGKDTLLITHKEIAKDLHTSREAISRLLKKMENIGLVTLSRNQIKIINLNQ